MDEPTVGIDPQSRNHILNAVKELNKNGTTIIYTTHYMEEAESLCTKIGIMDKGRIIDEGTKNQLKAMVNHKHKLTIKVDDPSKIDMDNNKYFQLQKISAKHSPSSMEYYGVAELGLMSFYYITYALFSMKNDERKQIKDRISITGIKTYKYYLGKVIGNVVCCYLTILSAYLLLRYILGVNYGDYIGVMPVALLVFVIISVSIGTLISVLVKDEGKADTILMSIVIPVLSFLGGGYIVLDDDLGFVGNFITRISPFRTFNKGVLGVIYGNSWSNFLIWILGGLAVSSVMNMIIILVAKRREGLYE